MSKNIAVIHFMIPCAFLLLCNCNNLTTNDNPSSDDIRGTYYLMEYGFEQFSDSALTEMQMIDSVEIANAMINDTLSISTLIITEDSIVRFGFHCPGDNIGTTRIAYHYKIENTHLIGDSLSGVREDSVARMEFRTVFEKINSDTLSITQVGKTHVVGQRHNFILISKGTYIKKNGTTFSLSDTPTCSDNYEPYFPIPFW
jgi:hypothetical protein